MQKPIILTTVAGLCMATMASAETPVLTVMTYDSFTSDWGALWADLADNIVTVTPGWSEAYGLFLEGEADAALSYTTSPAYHLIAEEDASKVAWAFDEGHYMQVEVGGAGPC